MRRQMSARHASWIAAGARRAWDRARRFIAGRAFVPVSVALGCALVVLTGAQVARLYSAVQAAGWLAPRDAVTFSGPGLVGAPSSLQAFVLGAVALPGAYQLPQGAHVADLVQAAGGLLSTADTVAVDQAALLAEGQALYVPYIGQAPTVGSASLVNINSAPADELRTSLGISSVTAAHIVAYRELHGPYTALSQLLLVPVSRKTFDRIRYLVAL